MSTVAIPDELTDQIEELIATLGYESIEEFVATAVEDKIQHIRKKLALAAAGEIREGLEERGQSIEEVLADFERFRNENQNRS